MKHTIHTKRNLFCERLIAALVILSVLFLVFGSAARDDTTITPDVDGLAQLTGVSE